ncbi:MAG: hypothetical protein VX438_10645, partial [Planctomycetota bacterium]|nr:hypothetical protein [Planctomycetota bacterium]
KKRIIRQHRRQEVTGLVVNSKVNLSRHRRRWLRSIQHRIKQGEKLTITMAEYQGWIALVQMVDPASKLVHFHREFVVPRTSESKTTGIPGNPRINAEAAQEPETNSTQANDELTDPGVKTGDDWDEHRRVNQEPPSQADVSGDRSEMAAETGNITQETSGVENDQNGSSQQDELESLSVDADVFHEDRLEDQVQALKAAKPYSPEAKQLQNDFISSIHTIRIQLESSKRTFSFRLPEGYQKGRTIMGTLSDGTSVELYFHDSLVEIIEEADFPLEGEINIEVVQWNATFKRVEAIVTGGLFH